MAHLEAPFGDNELKMLPIVRPVRDAIHLQMISAKCNSFPIIRNLEFQVIIMIMPLHYLPNSILPREPGSGCLSNSLEFTLFTVFRCENFSASGFPY